MNFKMKVPCSNCPFRKVGAIDLREGRLDGIIKDLLTNDYHTFHCHKTVHSKRGGEWREDGSYRPSGKESACMGAIAYMYRVGHTSVSVRMAFLLNKLSIEDVEKVMPEIIDHRLSV